MTREARTLRVGIAGREDQKARMLAIARGEYRPAPDEPKVWFTSMESLAQILSARNQTLLELIARARPASITELAHLSGRAKGNLARTLRTMSRYGFVELHRRERGRVEPRVAYDRLSLELPLGRGRRGSEAAAA